MVNTLSDIVSKETLLAQIPFVEDVQAELEKVKAERDENPFYQTAIGYQTRAMETEEEKEPVENEL
jgi:hypothetical protein